MCTYVSCTYVFLWVGTSVCTYVLFVYVCDFHVRLCIQVLVFVRTYCARIAVQGECVRLSACRVSAYVLVHVRTSVYMCLCAFTYVCVCFHVRFVCVCEDVCVRTYRVCTSVCVYVRISVGSYVSVYVRLSVCTYVCTCRVCTSVCVYVRISVGWYVSVYKC